MVLLRFKYIASGRSVGKLSSITLLLRNSVFSTFLVVLCVMGHGHVTIFQKMLQTYMLLYLVFKVDSGGLSRCCTHATRRSLPQCW